MEGITPFDQIVADVLEGQREYERPRKEAEGKLEMPASTRPPTTGSIGRE